MYWRGHVGLGLLTYAPFAAVALVADELRLAGVGVVLAIAFAPLPDADQHLPIAHRGPTHTIAFIVATGAIATLTSVFVTALFGFSPPSWTPLFVFGVTTATLGSHLVGDVLTPMGIRPFRPVSGAHFTLNVTPAKNRRANLALLGLGIVAMAVAVAVAG